MTPLLWRGKPSSPSRQWDGRDSNPLVSDNRPLADRMRRGRNVTGEVRPRLYAPLSPAGRYEGADGQVGVVESNGW